MKVAFDSQIFCSQKHGGVSRYISSLASNLSLFNGIDVRIIAPYHINAYLNQLECGIVSGKMIERPPFIGNYLRFGNQLLGLATVKRFSPDIIHETYYSRYLNWSKKSRHVITVYDMIHELFPENFRNDRQLSLKKKIAVEKADKIICISENTKNDLLNYYDLPEETVSVVHLGYEMQVRNRHAVSESRELDNLKYLLFVGERQGYKNFDNFLKAYAGSTFLRENFILICFGGGIFRNYEYELMRELDISDTQIKQVTGDDSLLASYYKHAVVFVFPSLYEGFGIPLLEAMSNNCPVACSNTASFPEVSADAAAFFDPADSDSIRDVLENIIQSGDRLCDLREKGKNRIQAFSWKKCALETLNVYRESLRGG